MFDYVRCLYCDCLSLVPLGTDICVKCGTDGHLVWVDAEKAEANAEDFPHKEAEGLLEGDFWEKAEADSAR